MAPKARPIAAKEAAETLAIQALTFIAADGERLGRFLATSGIGPEGIRAAAREPGFLLGVLDHLIADEKLLVAFAQDAGVGPETVAAAWSALGGGDEDRQLS